MRKTTAIIRDKYQLTIPEEIRKYLLWIAPQKAVRVVLVNKEKFLIEPYTEKRANWQAIWKSLKIIRAQGKKTSLAKFVIQDREKH